MIEISHKQASAIRLLKRKSLQSDEEGQALSKKEKEDDEALLTRLEDCASGIEHVKKIMKSTDRPLTLAKIPLTPEFRESFLAASGGTLAIGGRMLTM